MIKTSLINWYTIALGVVGLLTACQATSENETLYKTTLTELKKLVAEMEEVAPEPTVRVLEGHYYQIHDLSKTQELLKNRKETLSVIQNNFMNIIGDPEATVWGDDALLGLAIEHYLLVQHYQAGEEHLLQPSVDKIEMFVGYKEPFHLEDWTREQLREVFDADGIPGPYPEKAKLDAVLLTAVGHAYLGFKYLDDAAHYYQQVIQVLPDSSLAEIAKTQLEIVRGDVEMPPSTIIEELPKTQ